MRYSRQEIINKCEKAFMNIPLLYQEDFINYRGKTNDTDEYYTEVISEYIIERINEFIEGIPVISRKQGYNVNHDGSYTEGTGRNEEITAIKMFTQCRQGSEYNYIGKIIDYQTPLKASRSDKAGKIDLLSFDGKLARILELKKPDSDETMLRCVLEGFTYLCTVDKSLLIKDFELPADTIVKASPFVFVDGVQWQEWKENRPYLTRLMELLDSKAFFIGIEEERYYVVEE